MGEPRIGQYTLEEYLALELEDNRRYDYHDGRVWPVDDMAGGSWEHTLLCANAFRVLDQLDTYIALTSEIKIRIKKKN